MNIIIIPYRNRKRHLDYFIEHSAPLLQILLPNLKIIVMEQANDKPFNRGCLMNIGYDIFKQSDNTFFTHDVDINPTKECIEKYYTLPVNDDEIIGIYSAMHSLGGIIKFNSNTFKKINGFPNNYWGWGNEDTILQKRAEFYNIKIKKNFYQFRGGKWFKIFDDVNDRVIIKDTRINSTIFDSLSNKDKEQSIISNGINTLKYNIIERNNINNHIELIKVDF